MQKFHITTIDPRGTSSTPLEAATEAAAVAEARRTLGDMAKDNLPDCDGMQLRVGVTKENGEAVYQASLEFQSRWAG